MQRVVPWSRRLLGARSAHPKDRLIGVQLPVRVTVTFVSRLRQGDNGTTSDTVNDSEPIATTDRVSDAVTFEKEFRTFRWLARG